MSINYSVEGFKELDKELNKLDRRAKGKASIKALRAGGKIIAVKAKEKVPVWRGVLKKSIGLTVAKVNGEKLVLVLPRKGKNRKYDGFHAHFTEFGTVHSAAQPFLRPAAEEGAEEAIKAVGKTLAAEILAAYK